MKVLLVDSNRVVRTPDLQVYSLGSGSNGYWRYERYLKHFDEMIVANRMTESKQLPENAELSSGPRLTFTPLPDDHGKKIDQLFNNGYVKQIINKQLQYCDALIARGSRHGFIAAKLAQEKKIPWAIEVNGDTWDGLWHCGKPYAKLYAPYAFIQAKYWIKKASHAIFVTKYSLQKRYPCDGVVAGVSDVHIDSVCNSILEQREKKTVDVNSKSNVVIGSIGSLISAYKGFDVAMQALSLLRKKGINASLHILGPGDCQPWRQQAQQIGVADHVHFYGVLPSGDAVFRWLDKLDIYIQPSFTEGLPRALAEAMSRGLPALASNCGGIPELLSADCLHRPGNKEMLSKQLEQMICDAGWRLSKVRRNFEEAKNYYKPVLDARRDKFWAAFAAYAKANRMKQHT